jgi:hypothetical protein
MMFMVVAKRFSFQDKAMAEQAVSFGLVDSKQ